MTRAALWRSGLLLVAATTVAAAPPPPSSPPPPPPPAGSQPDESFIEFLGADDVPDARWWDFLKNTEPPPGQSSAPPPQDAQR